MYKKFREVQKTRLLNGIGEFILMIPLRMIVCRNHLVLVVEVNVYTLK